MRQPKALQVQEPVQVNQAYPASAAASPEPPCPQCPVLAMHHSIFNSQV